MPRSPLTLLAFALLLPPASARAQAPAPASQPASQAASAPAVLPAAPPLTASAASPGEAVASGKEMPHEAELAARNGDLVKEDLETPIELFRRGSFDLKMGGLLQISAAFYVGDGASSCCSNDPVTTEGFRVRRARFGFGGHITTDFTYYLAADLKDAIYAALGGDKGTEILDAKIAWEHFSFAHVSIGMDKVPFSSFAMESSSRLTLIERPLSVQALGIAPERRAGLTVSGSVWRLRYAAGLYNGSDGVTTGNILAGLAGAAHLELNVLGTSPSFVPHDLYFSVGGGYMYNDNGSTNAHKASASLEAAYLRFRLVGEFLWEHSDPKTDQQTEVPITAAVTRLGAIGELSAFVFRRFVQLAFRYEYYDANKDVSTLGRQQLLTAGANLYLYRHRLKLQLNYIRRDELDGATIENDIAYLQVQGMF
jgi:hypothetical protein